MELKLNRDQSWPTDNWAGVHRAGRLCSLPSASVVTVASGDQTTEAQRELPPQTLIAERLDHKRLRGNSLKEALLCAAGPEPVSSFSCTVNNVNMKKHRLSNDVRLKVTEERAHIKHAENR